jgi:shikimate 5-dehydrogenase
LLERWQNSGRATLDGLDLLVWQAIGQLELMGFDEEVFVERKSELHGAMRSAALALLIQ